MNKYIKQLLIVLSCGFLFFIVGEPFRAYFKLTDVTEVRPVSAFPLLFGLIFGFSGTLGCAISNFISDMISGYSLPVRIYGFFIQIIYGYVPVLIYNHWRRNEANKFRLDKVFKTVQYLLLVLADSILPALLIWGYSSIIYKTKFYWLGFFNTFFNQLIFFIIIGIPVLLLAATNKEWKKKRTKDSKSVISFSLNEKFILFFLIFSIVISLLFSFCAYHIFLGIYSSDPIHLWSFVFFSCGLSLFVCLCPALVFLYYIETKVTEPIERMSSAAKNFGKGMDLNLEIEKILMKCHKYIYFSSEIGNLARSYDYMAKELVHYIENLTKISVEKEKTETQMKIASEIQLGALPKPIKFEQVDLFVTMKPAQQVGGDFYDFFKIDDKHLGLVIADVSGKGVPAALFMMISKIILRKNMKAGLSPADAMSATNDELCETNPLDMFVTCLCGVLDLDTKMFTFANAGHEKPALCKAGKTFSFLSTKTGLVLGGIPGIKYHNEELQLEKDDILFNYTDGIPEAMNPDNQEFGDNRLIETLNAVKDEELSEICNNMQDAIRKFNDTAPQFDDITMLAIKIK